MSRPPAGGVRALGVLLGVALACLAPAAAAAQPWVTFLEQQRRVGPRQEWSREIVARNPGVFRCRVESPGALGVTLVADRTYQAMLRRDASQMRGEEVLFTGDARDGVFERELSVPAAGSYWVIMENQTGGEVEIRLACLAPAKR